MSELSFVHDVRNIPPRRTSPSALAMCEWLLFIVIVFCFLCDVIFLFMLLFVVFHAVVCLLSHFMSGKYFCHMSLRRSTTVSEVNDALYVVVFPLSGNVIRKAYFPDSSGIVELS